MKEQEVLTQWLQDLHGYTVFDTSFEHPYTFKTKLSKRVESESVCECNDKLSIYITVAQMDVIADVRSNFVDVQYNSRKEKWWTLKVHYLPIDEVLNDIKVK